MDILRFITAGNVDDGKSTLIGRLLYDTGNIKSDVLQSVSAENSDAINLAHVTDGLRAEREQGITIDVAYKYFTTPGRKYIITDAPGHFRYTKNLVTGASGVDVVIILVDARNGITEQTRRHALVASFLGIKHVVVAINKMDLQHFSEPLFLQIKNEFVQIASRLQLYDLTFIPISALLGDNVSVPSKQMDWYHGPTLMQYLERAAPAETQINIARFAVQCVITSDKKRFEKGYAGRLLSGRLSVGDEIGIYPSGATTTIRSIVHGHFEATAALTGEDIVIYTDGDKPIERGDVVAHPHLAPFCNKEFEAVVCWLDEQAPLQTGTSYLLRISGIERQCRVSHVLYKTDVNTLEKYMGEAFVNVNEFAVVRIETDLPVAFDIFAVLPAGGRGIIIDPRTNNTAGAFTINR